MFESYNFNQPVGIIRGKSLYTREHELLHELNSNEEYTNLAFEYNSTYRATHARTSLMTYAKSFNMPFRFTTRRSTLFVIKEENNG